MQRRSETGHLYRPMRVPTCAGVSLALCAAIACLVGLAAGQAVCDVHYVRSTDGFDAGPCLSDTSPCRTLAYAIFRASAGDTIWVAGEYLESVTIDESLTLLGKSAASGPFSDPWAECSGAAGSAACPRLRPPADQSVATIDGTITTTVTLDNMNILDSKGAAALVVSNGALVLRDSDIYDNTSSFVVGEGRGAGLFVDSNGAAQVERTRFERNAARSGGAIYARGALSVLDSTFTMNEAISAGGALAISQVSGFSVANSQLVSNFSEGSGGAISVVEGSGILDGLSLSMNALPETLPGLYQLGGAALSVVAADVTLIRSIVEDHVTVSGDSAAIEVSSGAHLTLAESTLRDNDQFGVFVSEATLEVRDSTVSGHGGAGLIDALLSPFSVSSDIDITGSTLVDNGVDVLSASAGTLTIVNSTFEDPDTNVSKTGGFADITSSTLVGATALHAEATGTISVRDSIVSGLCETVGSGAVITFLDSNLHDDPSCAPNPAADVRLEALAQNGGPTETRRPLPDSQAINAGGLRCLASPVNAVDQRGFPRPVGGLCDLGAIEVPEPASSLALLAGSLALCGFARASGRPGRRAA